MTFTYSYRFINGGHDCSLEERCVLFTAGLGPEQCSGYKWDSGGGWLPERAKNHQDIGPLFTLAFQTIWRHSLGPRDWKNPGFSNAYSKPPFLQCIYHSLAAIELKTVHWKAMSGTVYICFQLSLFVALSFPLWGISTKCFQQFSWIDH